MRGSEKSLWYRQFMQQQFHLPATVFSKAKSSNHRLKSPVRALSNPIKNPQNFFAILRSANSVWNRSSREQFFLWIKGSQRQHFGPECHIPDLFERRDQTYFALQARQVQWNLPPPTHYHDLLEAAAKVGALEERLGYVFRDKMICIEAIKNTSPKFSLYFSGQTHEVEKNNRLALVGDRALSLVMCEFWYKEGYMTMDYDKLVTAEVTRAALGSRGRNLNFHKYLLAGNSKSDNDEIAETFEAILGAIHVDSNYAMHALRLVVKRTGLSDNLLSRVRNMSGENVTTTSKTLEETRELEESQNVDSISTASPTSAPLQSLSTSQSAAQSDATLLSKSQIRKLALENSSVVTTGDQRLEQVQRQSEELSLQNSSFGMKEDDDGMVSMEGRQEALWVKAVQTSTRVNTDSSSTSIQETYESLVQKQERIRVFNERDQKAKARREIYIRLAEKQKAQLRSLVTVNSRRRENPGIKEARKQQIQRAAQPRKQKELAVSTASNQDEAGSQAPQDSDLTVSMPKQETSLEGAKKAPVPKVKMTPQKERSNRTERNKDMDTVISSPKRTALDQTGASKKVVIEKENNESTIPGTLVAEKDSSSTTAQIDINLNGDSVNGIASEESQNASASSKSTMMYRPPQKKATGLKSSGSQKNNFQREQSRASTRTTTTTTTITSLEDLKQLESEIEDSFDEPGKAAKNEVSGPQKKKHQPVKASQSQTIVSESKAEKISVSEEDNGNRDTSSAGVQEGIIQHLVHVGQASNPMKNKST